MPVSRDQFPGNDVHWKPEAKRVASDVASMPDDLAPGAPMTKAQAARLKALAQEAGDDQAFRASLTAVEAARRIRALEALRARETDSGTIRFPST
jgi:hypothetical protein